MESTIPALIFDPADGGLDVLQVGCEPGALIELASVPDETLLTHREALIDILCEGRDFEARELAAVYPVEYRTFHPDAGDAEILRSYIGNEIHDFLPYRQKHDTPEYAAEAAGKAFAALGKCYAECGIQTATVRPDGDAVCFLALTPAYTENTPAEEREHEAETFLAAFLATRLAETPETGMATADAPSM